MEKNKENYLKNIIYLNLQKKEIAQIMKKRKFKKYEFYLVDKDIIDNYKEKKRIDEYRDLYENDSYINDMIKLLYSKNFDLETKRLNQYFLLVEKLKIKDIEYPYNFCLLNKFIFYSIIDSSQSQDFQLYNTYICK